MRVKGEIIILDYSDDFEIINLASRAYIFKVKKIIIRLRTIGERKGDY